MNKLQKTMLKIFTTLFVILFIFPPIYYRGYGFIFIDGGIVNIGILILEWIVLAVICATIYLLKSSKKTDKQD